MSELLHFFIVHVAFMLPLDEASLVCKVDRRQNLSLGQEDLAYLLPRVSQSCQHVCGELGSCRIYALQGQKEAGQRLLGILEYH